MTATHTSRRALLKGAAMLTAIPVSVSAAGVPLFEVLDDLLPGATALPAGFDLSTTEGRIWAAVDWLGLPPPPLTYDEEETRAGENFLLTEELLAWLKETDLQPHLRWIFSGDATGATAEEQRTRLMQDREILDLFRGLDETEQAIMVEAIERMADKSIPMEVVQAESMAKLDAYRAAKQTRVQ